MEFIDPTEALLSVRNSRERASEAQRRQSAAARLGRGDRRRPTGARSATCCSPTSSPPVSPVRCTSQRARTPDCRRRGRRRSRGRCGDPRRAPRTPGAGDTCVSDRSRHPRPSRPRRGRGACSHDRRGPRTTVSPRASRRSSSSPRVSPEPARPGWRASAGWPRRSREHGMRLVGPQRLGRGEQRSDDQPQRDPRTADPRARPRRVLLPVGHSRDRYLDTAARRHLGLSTFVSAGQPGRCVG